MARELTKEELERIDLYLNRGYELKTEIDDNIEILQHLNEIKNSLPGGASGEGISKSRSTNAYYTSPADTATDIENEIKQQNRELEKLYAELIISIKKVKDSNSKSLLTKRYLLFKKWETIAEEMDYSVRNIFELRKKALSDYNEINHCIELQ